MYDQLGAASGWTRLLWLAMEYMPTRLRVERPAASADKDTNDEWWSAGGRTHVWAWVVNRGRGRPVAGHEVAAGMHVHRSVKTRLEARGMRLGHAREGAHEDAHGRLGEGERGEDGRGEAGADERGADGRGAGRRGAAGGTSEVYVPQLRPELPGRTRPQRLEHREWNVEVPEHWQWVD
ncbi:uncharacterized protein PHACADRAFT_254734 [Phanerochaete carnosa HHB-10118-sp]|uniref:Uncharacterized protein n=1 Tax=Phanerochaete carnosa (strain HHB-10118-sp) TaxID=650164 RepID=K5X2X3_PHACS|nr:uncharacterized protein PHACADRAFT_254734 [Phanerochaete carnosa HHB-10118-sp]EKM57157.1 hypothetical protein PHACADRAFT_254734 [Phanerochaete carnosa HHB-10118-sp]